MILNGKELSNIIKNDLKKEVSHLKTVYSFNYKLATILVGDNLSSKTYVKMKEKACREIGLDFTLVNMSENSTTEEVLKTIDELNKNKEVCGILLQHPVPKHIDETKCFNAILEEKDVDGVNTNNLGKLFINLPCFAPATPLGIMLLLEHYSIDLEGKRAVVVGRSQILGKPVASMLLNKNATVTVTHSKTTNLPELLKTADIVVACLGKPHFIKTNSLKKGVIIIDAGYNEGNIGDVDIENINEIASYYTPVPGGVGPMTIAALLVQTVKAAKTMLLKK